MPGLLDARGGFNDPITMGLLGASQALLTPMSQGGGLGAAFGAFPAAQQAALKNKYLQQQMEGQEMEGKLRQMQLIASMKKMDDEARAQDYMTRRMGGWNPSSGAALSAEAQTGGQLGPTNAAAGRLQTGGGGQKFPFSVDEVTALTKMGIPGLWDQYKFFNTPQELRAGSVAIDRNTGERTSNPLLEKGMVLDPKGNVAAAPGFTETLTNLTRAAEEAKLPYGTPIQIKQADGTVRFVRPDQFFQETGGRGSQSLPGARPQPQTPTGGMPGQPNMPGLVSGETTEAQDNRAARNANTERFNTAWIKSADAIVEEGAKASKSISDMQILRGMNLKSGVGSSEKAFLANLFSGVHPSLGAYASQMERFASVATDTTLQKQLEQAGVATKSDTEMAAKVGPSLSKTPEANAFAIDYIEAIARVKEQKARYYQMMRAAAQEAGETNLSSIDKRWLKLQQTNPALSVFGQPTMQRWAPQR